jgi:FKBP-type peptidyl-prolyl cis-trans isomerase
MNKTLCSSLLMLAALQSCVQDNVITAKGQLAIDTTKIGRFLRENAITATEDPSGFWYAIDTLAIGPYPALSDSVKISYVARLIPSLAPVDSVKSKNFLLSGVIAGIQLGLLKFPKGSYGRLYIPSGLAFGVTLHGSIPENSNLFYEIRLDSVMGTHLASDVATIDSYLQSHSLIPVKDTTGVRYLIDSAVVSSTKPALGDSLDVTYTGRVLDSPKAFDSVATTMRVALNAQIAAWKIVLPKIPEGSIVSIYAPSAFGFGSNASDVAPGSILVYRIRLKGVIHP